uniref:CLU central domain-containing protein n=1 Tax=Amphimedon queenslandica TaxID=400682 RepID=A0A1X7TRI1_AMPQE
MSISFSSNSVTHMCTTCGVSKVSLLREFCNKTGVQITLKDYKFSLTAPFNEGDLACIVPVVKHTDFKPLEASGLYELAQVQLQSGNIEVALDYLSEAVQLFAQVFGPLHVNIANFYKVIAQIHHALGDSKLAISYQHKTVIMYERLLGVDHCSSISAYFPTKHAKMSSNFDTSLGHYCCGA